MEDVKIKLSALWVTHFLLWSFGDMLRLIQTGGIEKFIAEPVADELLLFVAVPLAVIQTFMILISLMWEHKANRPANLSMGLLFIVVNMGHVVDVILNQLGIWEIQLVVVYLIFNVLVIKFAWEWHTPENSA